MPKLHPVDSLFKIIVAIMLWLIADAFGNVAVILLTATIEDFPSSSVFTGLNLVRPIGLVLVNVYVIYQAAKDIVEFIEYVKSSGFRLY